MDAPWRPFDQEELERQHNPRASVSDFDAEIANHRRLSAGCYEIFAVIGDLPYVPTETQKID